MARGTIIRILLYCQCATSSLAQTNKNQFIQPGWALGLFLCVLRLCDLSLCSCMFLFYLGQLSYLPSYFGAGVTNLNESPSQFSDASFLGPL